MVQASEAVVAHAGGAWDASLNLVGVGGNCLALVQQIDRWCYVVGQDDFNVYRYTLDEWQGITEQADPPFIQADDAEQAWELLRLVRDGAFLWQCGGCDAWVFTTDRPRIGVLPCGVCGHGGVDFAHADRHVRPGD